MTTARKLLSAKLERDVATECLETARPISRQFLTARFDPRPTRHIIQDPAAVLQARKWAKPIPAGRFRRRLNASLARTERFRAVRRWYNFGFPAHGVVKSPHCGTNGPLSSMAII